MCPPFYTVNDISGAEAVVVQNFTRAADLRYLQTTGSMILHEMMHTAYISNSPPNPLSKFSGDFLP